MRNIRDYILEMTTDESITPEMRDWFTQRTAKHIDLVKKYAHRIYELDPNRWKPLLDQVENHDDSKYQEPEKTPYIYISWNYHCKDLGIPYQIPDNIDGTAATNYHVKNNMHHPEYWSDQVDTINREDRDKPPENMIDASGMDDISIGEMCADWAGMSEEKGTNTPQEWADKNINIRWKFTPKQIDLIYGILNAIWK